MFHYVPLHDSPRGAAVRRTHGELSVTEEISERLMRLPLWAAMAPADVDHVVAALFDAVGMERPASAALGADCQTGARGPAAVDY